MTPGALIVAGMAIASVVLFLFLWACCAISAEGKGDDE